MRIIQVALEGMSTMIHLSVLKMSVDRMNPMKQVCNINMVDASNL